jgi:hypothetical protein
MHRNETMCELRNGYYDTGFVKWRALICLGDVSKSYSYTEKKLFEKGLYLVQIMLPFMIVLAISLLAFILLDVDTNFIFYSKRFVK